jgi:hypothetical protein
MAQLVTTFDSDLLSEVSLALADEFFKDFPQKIYSQQAFRAARSISKEFDIFERTISLTMETDDIDDDTEIAILPLNFSYESHFSVNGTEYTKTSFPFQNIEDDDTLYYVRYVSNQYVFNYTNKAVDDVVNIHYSSVISGTDDYAATDDYSNENIIPVIPNRFYEEHLKRTILLMCKLGVAKYANNTDTGAKYQRLFGLYSGERQEAHLHSNKTWVEIKPFRYP